LLDVIAQANEVALKDFAATFCLLFGALGLRAVGPSGCSSAALRSGFWGDRIRDGGEARVGKSFVVVERENVVAVGGDQKLRVGLAGRRADNVEKLIFVKGVRTVQFQRSHASLLALVDDKAHVQVAFLTLVVVEKLSVNLGLLKAIGEIQIQQRVLV